MTAEQQSGQGQLVDGISVDGLLTDFQGFSGAGPEGIWRSPGRVNLIGEHTDYNDGLALPFAIDLATFVAARRRPDRSSGVVAVRSANLDKQASADLSELSRWEPKSWESWARYPLGVFWVLAQRGAQLPGMDLLISSSVPRGGGLSSSAALTVSVAVALTDLAGISLSPLELARVAQDAESRFAGIPCGLLDQMAVVDSKPGEAVLIDFAALSTELVPMPGAPVTIIDTLVERDNASGAYANRRAACQKAASELGLSSLREADLDMVERGLQGELQKRARHIVTENTRVLQAVSRLRDAKSIGDLLVASHRSLREDYEVSIPQLDLAVETALENGAEGARLTGAGLGGCAIALGASAQNLAGPMESAFAAAGFRSPKVFGVTPSAGAGRLV